jgi:PEP-CTERM motif
LKTRIALLSLFALCLTLAAVPAMAQCPGYCYDNGPVNGQVDAWTINFGFAVSDTFHLTAETDIQQLSFWAWVEPGDTVTSVEVAIGSTGYFSNNVFDGTVTLTQSNCFTNNFGFDVCAETGNFNVQPSAGNYYLTLENAATLDGNPLYWDENSGVGCTSPGCPSSAQENTLGSIPSEAFTLSGTPSSTTSGTGTTPEPSSIMLLGSGILGLAGLLRRKLF